MVATAASLASYQEHHSTLKCNTNAGGDGPCIDTGETAIPEGHRHLTENDRCQIHALLESGLSEWRSPVNSAATGRRSGGRTSGSAAVWDTATVRRGEGAAQKALIISRQTGFQPFRRRIRGARTIGIPAF